MLQLLFCHVSSCTLLESKRAACVVGLRELSLEMGNLDCGPRGVKKKSCCISCLASTWLHASVLLQVQQKENFHLRRRKRVKMKEGKAPKSTTISIPLFENLSKDPLPAVSCLVKGTSAPLGAGNGVPEFSMCPTVVFSSRSVLPSSRLVPLSHKLSELMLVQKDTSNSLLRPHSLVHVFHVST